MTQQGEVPQGAAARERFCIHYRTQPPGAYYGGIEYVAALQRLKADAAMRAAGNVEAFFWKDAPGVKVWLCHPCAAELALRNGSTSGS
jgi:hypothetical protein